MHCYSSQKFLIPDTAEHKAPSSRAGFISSQPPGYWCFHSVPDKQQKMDGWLDWTVDAEGVCETGPETTQLSAETADSLRTEIKIASFWYFRVHRWCKSDAIWILNCLKNVVKNTFFARGESVTEGAYSIVRNVTMVTLPFTMPPVVPWIGWERSRVIAVLSVGACREVSEHL